MMTAPLTELPLQQISEQLMRTFESFAIAYNVRTPEMTGAAQTMWPPDEQFFGRRAEVAHFADHRVLGARLEIGSSWEPPRCSRCPCTSGTTTTGRSSWAGWTRSARASSSWSVCYSGCWTGPTVRDRLGAVHRAQRLGVLRTPDRTR
jgi:hypothetical protein